MEKTTLFELQKMIHKKREDRGFVMEPIKIFTLLTEEIGEVATELKKCGLLIMINWIEISWQKKLLMYKYV